jgi:fatty-acyl-CoA synthase
MKTESSTAKAWLRALERTAPIAAHPNRVLPTVIDDLAENLGEAPALLSDRECFSYRELSERANRYARWALDAGIAKGDVVGLFMPNRPAYMAIWLGITRVGGVVALLNTHLVGPSLAHCVEVVAPKHIIAASELVEVLSAALRPAAQAATIWVHGPSRDGRPRIDREIERYAGGALSSAERRPLTIEDRALYIYTSGTTGLPKAATVSHARLMQWSHWFAGLMDTRPTDRMYNCLPMYHSVGGVLATGAVLVGGGAVVLSERFSARRFWSDVTRWDCTLFQYIGELCRYLLQTPPAPGETAHRLRLACGNGLGPDIWTAFQSRFRIPRILEFYASTEGNVSLFNVDGQCAAIGRIPPFLAHRFPAALVRLDASGEPGRDAQGRCRRCGPNEVGEAIGKIVTDAVNVGARFEGYTSADATERKILRNVFESGDAWFRTGDLMRRDDKGYFYFVDRVGDTFRWRGENVSTAEVAHALCACPGVLDAVVYGVAVPGADGRAGMATIVAGPGFDVTALARHLADRLPVYAQPVFLRVRAELDLTPTFKPKKQELAREGYDPAVVGEALYVRDPEHDTFIPLDADLHQRLQAGGLRL